jgi:hypothetical protein
MKQLLGIIFIFISLQSVGQSKKKQILFLNQKVDSLQALLNVERSKSEENLTNARVLAFNLQEKINSLESQVSETKKLLKEIETALSNKNQINKEQQDIINKLKEELQVKEDSLNLLRSHQDIQLLPDNFFAISDVELIKLFNIKDKDLGTEFISEYEPDLKPEYSIQGKQFFELARKYYLLAVMGVSNPNSYHSSRGTCFVQNFIKTNKGWVPCGKTFEESDIPTGWGKPPTLENFQRCGAQKICVSISGGFLNMGYYFGQTDIIGLDKNFNFKILHSYTDENDGGNTGSDDRKNIDTSFEIDFKPSKSEYYDLEEREYNHDKLKNTRLLRFNPSTNKYEPVK